MKNANNRPEVRNARDAIDAYKNITDAIAAAEAAANEARTAAEAALTVSQRLVFYFNVATGGRFTKTLLFQSVKSQGLPQKAKDLKDNSNDLLAEAGRTENDLKSKWDAAAGADKLTLANSNFCFNRRCE